MITGIGTDIVKISRIREFIKRNGTTGKQLILSNAEMHLKNYKSIAGRFATKEAFLKAIGIGFSKGLRRLSEIEISKDTNGRPSIKTHGMVDEITKSMNIKNIHISISHDGDYALAFVVIS